uniref:Uncharacterized protein AlNc14C201G8689 n=1 Tax=Albugo laibachii Nc14 TaxID=890382 RepID=F0WQM7_9STRA|nr:PREDICTED: hypothetical protein [Albugo laibachii Nc14]|eukprot:CCA23636.1 PREDICTED: hypothetical protein [Albugo laibachii Nc14]
MTSICIAVVSDWINSPLRLVPSNSMSIISTLSTPPTAPSHACEIPTSSIASAFVPGAIAGVTADFLLHPFDTLNLRIKMQAENSVRLSKVLGRIVREEGFRGFFGGLGTTMTLSPMCAALYFGTYEYLKEASERYSTLQAHSGIVAFAAGAASEVAISSISVPAEVVKSRLQLGRNPRNATRGLVTKSSNYRNMVHAVCSIVQREGLRGLYAGYWACMSVDTFFSAFSFFFYENLKQHWRTEMKSNSNDNVTSLESLAFGSIAGGLAAFITNPLDVVTIRLMTQGDQNSYSGFWNCVRKMVRQEGCRGLWKGALCRTIAITPSTGICFGVYETAKRVFFSDACLS